MKNYREERKRERPNERTNERDEASKVDRAFEERRSGVRVRPRFMEGRQNRDTTGKDDTTYYDTVGCG